MGALKRGYLFRALKTLPVLTPSNLSPKMGFQSQSGLRGRHNALWCRIFCGPSLFFGVQVCQCLLRLLRWYACVCFVFYGGSQIPTCVLFTGSRFSFFTFCGFDFVTRTLLTLPWYRGNIEGTQEVMIGYSDSAKDAGRMAAAWAQYNAQVRFPVVLCSVWCVALSCLVLSCLVLFCLFSCLVLSCLVLSCLVLSCLVLSCLVLSCLVLSCLVLSCLVLSFLVLSCLVLSCLVLFCIALPCLVLPCLALPCLALPFLALSCLFLPFLVLSCSVLSCPIPCLVLSCLVPSLALLFLVLSCLVLSCPILSSITINYVRRRHSQPLTDGNFPTIYLGWRQTARF